MQEISQDQVLDHISLTQDHQLAAADLSQDQALDNTDLVQGHVLSLEDLAQQQFLENTEGSAIRRIGYERWLRNIAVALGNAETSSEVVAALRARQHAHSDLVTEHVNWALAQHEPSPETHDV